MSVRHPDGDGRVKQTTEEKRKRQIRAAAVRCFVRQGYASTRLVDIAREAGLSKGGVYFHYRAKEDLFQDIVATHLEVLHARWSFEPIADLPADRTLARLVEAHVRTLEDEPEENRLFHMLINLAARDESFRDKLKLVCRVMKDLYASVIAQGMREGKFAAGDPGERAQVVVSLVSGLGCYAALTPSTPPN